MGVIIGVDPHKASYTAAVLDARGELVDQQRLPAPGLARVRCAAGPSAGPSGAGPLRAPAALAAGSLSSCRRRRTSPRRAGQAGRPGAAAVAGHGRKSDAHDAVWVAVAALGAKRLGEVCLDDHTAVLRLLSDRRDDLVRQRTRTLNRLHVLLCDLLPSGAKRNLDAAIAAALLRRLRPATAPARTRRQLTVDLVADVRTLDRRIAAVKERLRQAVNRSATTLTDLFGVGHPGRQAPG